MRADSCILVLFLTLAGIAPIYGNDWAFTGTMPGGHRGPVNALVYKGDRILSAGEDGFLGVWDSRGAQYRFQLSPYSIIAMAERPGKDEICVIESDGMGLYRVSAWNFRERRNIFSLRLRDSVGSVFYSMGGNFIIAAKTASAGLSGGAGLVFIDSTSGNILQSPSSLTGIVRLAATGRTERNMLVYCASGTLSYWVLESGNETSRFEVLPNLYSPVLFSNSRYLAGLNAEGLAVINAVSGELMERDSSIPGNSLLYPAGDEFICLVRNEESGVSGNTAAEIYRYAIDRGGRLVRAGHLSLPASGNNEHFTALAAAGGRGSIAAGTDNGDIVLAGMNGQPHTLAVKEQIYVTEAAVSGSSIAFIAENGIGFIPRDFGQFSQNRTIRIEQNQNSFSRVTSFGEGNGSAGQFVFWQDGSARIQPVIWSSGTGGRKQQLGDITLRSPVRSADSLGGKILFLDSMGNITVITPPNTDKAFTFFSVGLMDAVFVDSSRIIIGRSAVSGNTPFMMINTDTGETVPLPYPSQAGVALYRGTSGSIYAAAVSSANEAEGMITSILHLNTANSAGSEKLVDFQGEETQFSLVESQGGVASTIGGEGAAIYTAAGLQDLERTAGLPLKLIDGGSRLISLDRDGNICWHDSRNGKLLAVFKLHPGGWTLQTPQRTITGGVVISE